MVRKQSRQQIDQILDDGLDLLVETQRILYLRRYIAKHVKIQADVADRVQDTLLEAFRAYPHFRCESSLNTWLIGIAKRQISLYYRQIDNTVNHLSYREDISINNVPENELYQAARNEQLLASLSKLSKSYQQILSWHALEGLSHAEIGKKLNISEYAVNMRISRARVALRRISKKI